MRIILIIVIAFLSLNAFAQIRNIKVPEVKNTSTKKPEEPDTVLRAAYVNKNVSERKPAYYLNGQFITWTVVKTINPKIIDSVRVEKQKIGIGDNMYDGQIFIKTKSVYKPILISLNELKAKYTDLKHSKTIFMIDNEIINEDYDKCLVDENYILMISIEKVNNKKERLNFNLVNLLTRTEENLKNSRKIIIRGI